MNPTYEILFESMQEGLIIVDNRGEIIEANRRSHQLFGYGDNELIGKVVNDLIPKEAKKRHTGHMNSYYKEPVNRNMGAGMNLKAVKKDGSNFYVEISLNPFEIDGEKKVAALITDISERAKYEQKIVELNNELERKVELRTKEVLESNDLYTAIARNFPNGTINVIDLEFKYIFAEGKELNAAGISSEQLIGTSYLDRMPAKVRTKIKTALLNVFKGNTEDFELEHEGSFYNINAVPLKNAINTTDKLLLIERNITEEKLIQQKQEEAFKKEKKLNDMKSRFVSMASHEFRTPLSTVLSSVSLIEKYIEKEQYVKTYKHTQRVKNAVKSLTHILNDFLSVDKLEDNKHELKNIRFNYQEFAHELSESIREICKKEQSLVCEVNADNPNIETDPNIVKNIIYNLLSNAIKYSKEGDEIRFESEIIQDVLTIRIRDCGIGIPKSEQKQLFSRFFRAENAANIEGTGLGMYIVKKYLDILGGIISFESVEHEGTTFELKIPINQNI